MGGWFDEAMKNVSTRADIHERFQDPNVTEVSFATRRLNAQESEHQ